MKRPPPDSKGIGAYELAKQHRLSKMTLSEIAKYKGFLMSIPEYKRQDLMAIQRIANDMNISISLRECMDVWSIWCSKKDAQWLGVSPDEVKQAIEFYIDKITHFEI